VPGELQVGLRLIAQHRPIRWYNPKLKDFEWREVPESDEEALSLLNSSSYPSTSTDTYLYWRSLGAGITAALMRASEEEVEEERS
jgi:hypothetical protein